MTKISVIMPAYNAARTLSQAVRSVQSQTLRNWELVICDDCSSDDTISLLKSISDPRVRWIRNSTNLGPGLSRNRAMEYAKGDWFVFLDADDVWLSDRLEILLNAVDGNIAHVAFDDILICHDAGDDGLIPWRRLRGPQGFAHRNRSGRIFDVSAIDYLKSRRLLIQPFFSSHFVKVLKVVHSNREFAEDAEFVIRLLAVGAKLRYVPEALYKYRLTKNSITALSSDLTAMRRCIESCRDSINWSPEIVVAFDYKVKQLKINEDLYRFVILVRSGDFISAGRCLLQHPQLLKLLPIRLFDAMKYHIHRKIHRTEKRSLAIIEG